MIDALSCDRQHSHMHNGYVVQLTAKLFKGQCRHLIDSDCVAIVFLDFPLYLRIKQVRLCTQKGIWATRFSSLNEQILLKLLVGVAPKIEANLKHLTDLIFLDLIVLTDSMVCSRFVSPQLFC
jgi:hypothetical protein